MFENESHIFNGPTSIGERISAMIKHYHLNKNSFSVRLGLQSNAYIVRVVNDPTVGINLTLIQKILQTFTEINPEWFVLGTGDMFKKDKSSNLKYQNIRYYKELGDKVADYMRVTGFEDCDLAFDVIGTGMAPKFRPGDIALCKTVKMENGLQLGEAHLIITKNTPLIRYIKGKTDESYRLGAEDSRYEDSVIDLKDIQSLYLIKGLVRKEVF